LLPTVSLVVRDGTGGIGRVRKLSTPPTVLGE
jgi:hypothetical protein